MVARLARRLDAQAAQLPRDPRGVPGTGAAGGLAGALWAAHGAELVLGARWVLEALGFEARLRAARCVVCGEGRIDRQSAEGKVVSEIAARARAAGRRVHAVVGRDELGGAGARRLGIASVIEATTAEEMAAAGERIGHLESAAPGMD
jgi:glycerate 2-kinase